MSSTSASTDVINGTVAATASAVVVTTTATAPIAAAVGEGGKGAGGGGGGTGTASKLVKSTPTAAATTAAVTLDSTNAGVQITIEDLYKWFGILADAKQQAGEVSRRPFLLFVSSIRVRVKI
jgi:hypothetical protein